MNFWKNYLWVWPFCSLFFSQYFIWFASGFMFAPLVRLWCSSYSLYIKTLNSWPWSWFWVVFSLIFFSRDKKMGKEKVYGVIIIVNQCVDRLFDWSTRDLRMELDNASRPKATQPPVNTHLVLRDPSEHYSSGRWLINESLLIMDYRYEYEGIEKKGYEKIILSKCVFELWIEKLKIFLQSRSSESGPRFSTRTLGLLH